MKYKHPRLAKCYYNMVDRCTNPNHKAYKYYGGKGITVCQEWVNSFEAFENWAIKAGYTDELTIDRIDNSKGYSPDNCQWVSKAMNTARISRFGNDKIPDYQIKNPSAKRNYHYGEPLVNLIKWEKENGFKAKHVAEKLNLSPSQYSQIKLGKIRPNIEVAERLQSEFNADPLKLLINHKGGD